MERNNFLKEFGVPVVLVLALVGFWNPCMVLMPPPVVMLALFLFMLASLLFALFFWKEKARDEREVLHRLSSGRVAFLTGSITLMLGVIFEVLVEHYVDPWLLIALGAMVIAKSVASYRSSRFE